MCKLFKYVFLEVLESNYITKLIFLVHRQIANIQIHFIQYDYFKLKMKI